MAPIFAAIGIIPQIIDDKRLGLLRINLESICLNERSGTDDRKPDSLNPPLDIERLVGLLQPWQSWTFEEQVSFMNWLVMVESYSSMASKLTFPNKFSFVGWSSGMGWASE